MSFNRFVLAAALVVAAVAPAYGQLGIGESPTGLLDLKPPVLSIASPPPRVIQGGTALSFRWTLSEPLPGPPGSHVARLFVGGVAADSSVESSLTGSFDWKCAIPEISVAGCRFEVAAVDARGNRARVQSDAFTILASWTGAPAIAVPGALLQPPRPNPANPGTEVSWILPASGHLRLFVYDLRGRHVAALVDGQAEAGGGSLHWQALDGRGRRLPGGIYCLRLEWNGPSGSLIESRRLVVLP